MDYTTLGRTGFRVSVMGLGAGGHSRLGQATGRSAEDSVAIVRRALELGINFVDTAEIYQTEHLVGEGIAASRDSVILSTKKTLSRDTGLISANDLAQGLEASLKRLRTDRVDIYHLHGVSVRDYPHAREQLVPAMQKLKQQGKIRAIGITEAFGSDTTHAMLSSALRDDCWDVIMVGFNILNQSARERVLEETRQKNIGVLDMFAVRSALSRPEKLRSTIKTLIDEGRIRADGVDPDSPLGFLTRDNVATSIPDAAYRFCRAEPGIDVVLSGTGNAGHLEQNVASILRPALPQRIRQQLVEMFAGVDSVSGQ